MSKVQKSYVAGVFRAELNWSAHPSKETEKHFVFVFVYMLGIMQKKETTHTNKNCMDKVTNV